MLSAQGVQDDPGPHGALSLDGSNCAITVWLLGGRAGDAIGSREDFKQIAVRVVEVDTAAIVSMVDGAGVPARRISPIVKAACVDASEYLVEFGFADEFLSKARRIQENEATCVDRLEIY
jgi:hypothetical protein